MVLEFVELDELELGGDAVGGEVLEPEYGLLGGVG